LKMENKNMKKITLILLTTGAIAFSTYAQNKTAFDMKVLSLTGTPPAEAIAQLQALPVSNDTEADTVNQFVSWNYFLKGDAENSLLFASKIKSPYWRVRITLDRYIRLGMVDEYADYLKQVSSDPAYNLPAVNLRLERAKYVIDGKRQLKKSECDSIINVLTTNSLQNAYTVDYENLYRKVNPAYYSSNDYASFVSTLAAAVPVNDNTVAFIGELQAKLALMDAPLTVTSTNADLNAKLGKWTTVHKLRGEITQRTPNWTVVKEESYERIKSLPVDQQESAMSNFVTRIKSNPK